MAKSDWTFLGDGVYARFDGYQVFVTIDQDLVNYDSWNDDTVEIALEPEVLESLVVYNNKKQKEI